MEDTLNSIKPLVWEYEDATPNAEFVVELLEVIVKNSLMTVDGEYFQQIFGVMMGTNVAPILATIYMAKLENLLQEKSKSNRKIICSVLLQRFIKYHFGITEANKEDFEFFGSRIQFA